MLNTAPNTSIRIRTWQLKYRIGEIGLMSGFFYVGFLFVPIPYSHASYLRLVLAALGIFPYIFSVYSLNSYCDYEIDQQNHRLSSLSQVKKHRYRQLMLQSLLLTAVLFSFSNAQVWVCFVFSFLLWILYYAPPARLKSKFLGGTLVHAVAGISHFHLCYAVLAPITARSIATGAYIGLLLAIGHLNHERIDFESDRKTGVNNTTVSKGLAFTGRYIRVISIVALIYWGVLYAISWIDTATFLVFLLPHALFLGIQIPKAVFDSPLRFQKYYRLFFALGGAVLVIHRLCLLFRL